MNYSKKQMLPLITRYGINPETNQLFLNICEMFDGQPNYQFWGVKVVFSKACTYETLSEIKEWVSKNQNLVQDLEKKNIIPYSKKEHIARLRAEMTNLDKIALVKNIISTFNTDQRHMLNDFVNMSNVTSINVTTNSRFTTLYDIFSKFSKISSARKANFITKNSAIRTMSTLITNLKQAIAVAYEWNREDLLAFVDNNTPDTKVVYDDGKNIVVLKVNSYESSSKICGGGRTSWCITTSDGQWKNYVVTPANAQYFFFDFSKNETHELAHIGFTVSPKQGICHAHSTTDKTLMGSGIAIDGMRVNIHQALKNATVPKNVFMPLKPFKGYKWEESSLVDCVKGNSHDLSLAYQKDNRVIVSALTSNGLNRITSHAYALINNYTPENGSMIYALFDFNLDAGNDNSTIYIVFQKDKYGTPSLTSIMDMYGSDMTKSDYLSKIGIKTADYLKRENISPDIMLHKLIDEHDESSAIKLIEDNAGTININYEFNNHIPVYSAMEAKMFKLVDVIINHDKFSTTCDNEWEEPLLTELLCLYTSERFIQSKNDENALRGMIETIMGNPRFDMNDQDLNLDSAVNICCEHPKLNWAAISLINRPDVNVNIVNEYNCTALSNAIQNPDKSVLQALGKRPDLIVRDDDNRLAHDCNINLADFIKPEPMEGLEKIVRKEPKREHFDLEALFEKAMKSCMASR